MTFGIYFDSDTSAEALRRALHTVYGIPPALVYVGTHEGLADLRGPDPVALITPVDGRFGHELGGGERLAEATGATELELARALCQAVGGRALVDDGTVAPHSWILVAGDGTYGPVRTDPDSEGLAVLYALAPIPGQPDLPVAPYAGSPSQLSNGGSTT